MRILLLDIETTPLTAYVWITEVYKAFIDPAKMIEPTRIICWSAKWYGEKELVTAGGDVAGLNELRGMLNEADAVVHYNGTRFDIPIINAQFLVHQMTPPSPYKQIDLKTVVKKHFWFDSSRLNHLSKRLELGEKLKHEGFDLWKKCMAGNKAALATMRAYNKQDV
ncbi:MAG: ribonuclease H-like domain-containing protein, partial [Nitrososphaera sp.]|nr:ribonuclease H-like domain-containing protein [Nitrososphaera sp.]